MGLRSFRSQDMMPYLLSMVQHVPISVSSTAESHGMELRVLSG